MYKCKYCGKECKNLSGLRNHEKACVLNPDRILRKYGPRTNANNSCSDYNKPQTLYCRFCNKECKSANSLHNHEIRCNRNPNKLQPIGHQVGAIGRPAWNKGLSKEADPRMQKIQFKATFGMLGKKHTEESKLKMKARRALVVSNRGGRGKKGWYKGFFCSSTYELAFLIYCLDKNIPIQKCPYVYEYEYEGLKHKYHPDFLINDTIVEIKGFYTDIVRAKTEAVKDRQIVVLYRQNLAEVFDYIQSTYNKTVDKNIQDLYEV